MSEPSQPTPPTGPEAPGAPVPPQQPPAPPAPPVPPVPQYGEYAPAGYVPPQPAPGFEAAAAAAQPYGTPQYPGQPFGAASYPAQPGARQRKTWDLVLTSVLLALGFFGMLLGVFYGVTFTDPAALDTVMKQQGYSGFNGSAGAAPAVLIGSHVVLYLIALGVSIPLLVRRRVAFWLPLAAGVLAAIIFWVTLFAVLLSDPGLIAQMR